jgi:FkbH-like protein
MLKVAILSNVTTSVLANMLSRSCCVWNDYAFDSWYQVSLAPTNALLDFNPDKILLLIDRHFSFVAGDEFKARQSLKNFFPQASIIVPDLKSMAQDFGELFYDERMWQLAKIPWSHQAHLELFKLLIPKKVAAVDFDDTLYAGAINESAFEEIRPNTIFLRELKKLKDDGILLLGLTKNDSSDVERLFTKEGFILSKDDFVEIYANWNEKPDNLREFSEKYRLSLDSFVFFDDNNSERARMRCACPEVTVASYPFNASNYFPVSAITPDDLVKTSMYKEEILRNRLAAKTSLEEYFSALKLKLAKTMLSDGNIDRIFQLSQKTNRFNVTTNRYSREDLVSFMNDENRRFFVFSASDSFGDYGVIAFVNVSVSGEKASITDWVMSCRAMGRTIEYAVQEVVEKELAASGVTLITSRYVDSGNNIPVKNLYDEFGFKPIQSSDAEKRYSLSLPRQKPIKKHFVFICT